MPNRKFMLLLGISLLANASPSAIAADDQPDNNGRWQIPQDCRAEPEAGQDGKAEQETRESLAKRLERCKGILKPPPTGDTETNIPAPDAGKTPVIPPGVIPDQPPDK